MFTLLMISGIERLAQDPQATGIPTWVWILLGLVLLAIILGLIFGSRSSSRENINTRSMTDVETPGTMPQTGAVVDEAPVIDRVDTDTGARIYDPPAETLVETPLVGATEGVENTQDLTIIEGIGPGIQKILNDAGIYTFDQLARSTPDDLREILRMSGLRVNDPQTWPEQARLASMGQWDELKDYQSRLNAGREM